MQSELHQFQFSRFKSYVTLTSPLA